MPFWSLNRKLLSPLMVYVEMKPFRQSKAKFLPPPSRQAVLAVRCAVIERQFARVHPARALPVNADESPDGNVDGVYVVVVDHHVMGAYPCVPHIRIGLERRLRQQKLASSNPAATVDAIAPRTQKVVDRTTTPRPREREFEAAESRLPSNMAQCATECDAPSPPTVSAGTNSRGASRCSAPPSSPLGSRQSSLAPTPTHPGLPSLPRPVGTLRAGWASAATRQAMGLVLPAPASQRTVADPGSRYRRSPPAH